jgi:Tfp pilus assembly protein PilX
MMLRRLRHDGGFALPLALLVMVATSAVLITSITTTSSSGRTANLSRTKLSAESLAEAGIANALAILAKPGNNPNSQSLLPTPPAAGLYYPMETGSATVWGTYNTTTYAWTLTSIGSLANPTGGAPVTKTITKSATVLGIAAGATVPEWSRFIHDDATTCFTIDTVTIPGAVASRGDMCLKNGGNVAVNTTGAATTVGVGDDLFIEGPDVSSPWRTAPTVTNTGWTNATVAYLATSDGNRTTDSIPLNSQSGALDATGFFNSPSGNNIPATAIIRGIQVEIVRRADNTNVDDEDVLLLKGGSTSGITDHASGTDWGTSDATVTYGDTDDLWGTTWTAAQINASNFGVRLRVDNDNGSAARLASINRIRVTVTYTSDPTAAIGSAASPIERADIADYCTLNADPTPSKPCTSADRVYATTIAGAPANLVKPQVDLDWWWARAKPGPKYPCTEAGNTFPNGFDNDAGTTSAPNNSIGGSAEITPMNQSYTCQVKENGVLVGEISWNNATHVLKIFGTIYIDGDMRFDDNGQIVHYQGRGIIYASDDIEFDERVCAGGSGMTDCAASPATMSAWDPSQNLLTILAGNLSTSQPCCPVQENAEFDHSTQGTNSAQGDDPAAPGAFQGIVYAKGNCQVHEYFKLSGPVICNQIQIDEGIEATFPAFSPFPPLGSLVDGSIYLNPNNAATFQMQLGAQTG